MFAPSGPLKGQRPVQVSASIYSCPHGQHRQLFRIWFEGKRKQTVIERRSQGRARVKQKMRRMVNRLLARVEKRSLAKSLALLIQGGRHRFAWSLLWQIRPTCHPHYFAKKSSLGQESERQLGHPRFRNWPKMDPKAVPFSGPDSGPDSGTGFRPH